MLQIGKNFSRRIKVSQMDLSAREYVKIHINTDNIPKTHIQLKSFQRYFSCFFNTKLSWLNQKLNYTE